MAILPRREKKRNEKKKTWLNNQEVLSEYWYYSDGKIMSEFNKFPNYSLFTKWDHNGYIINTKIIQENIEYDLGLKSGIIEFDSDENHNQSISVRNLNDSTNKTAVLYLLRDGIDLYPKKQLNNFRIIK